jgi:hypothetical protein
MSVTSTMDKKLEVYLAQTGIQDVDRARARIQNHLSSQATKYPYVLYRNRTLYLFNAAGLEDMEGMPAKKGADYLRFDGETITQLDPEYYLGPDLEADDRDDTEGWMLGGTTSNNNNNNNNNNNGNNNG